MEPINVFKGSHSSIHSNSTLVTNHSTNKAISMVLHRKSCWRRFMSKNSVKIQFIIRAETESRLKKLPCQKLF